MGNKRPHELDDNVSAEDTYKILKSRQPNSSFKQDAAQKYRNPGSAIKLNSGTEKRQSSSAEERLAQLAHLSHELVNDPELTTECAKIAGDDVVSAALNLGHVFHSKQSLVLSLPQVSSASKANQPGLSVISGQSLHVEQNSTHLPELPRVSDPVLAKTPFIHRWTAAKERAPSVDGNYERLEFLGDAYIEVIASRFIYPLFPQMPAGRLSQIRELLVKNETLAQFSLAYKFDERAAIPISHLEGRENRAKLWNKTLGDMFEAYVAAVILSDPQNGFAMAEAWLATLWSPKLPGHEDHSPPENSAAKQDLAKKIMGKGTKIEYQDEGQKRVKKEGKIWFNIGAYFSGWGWEKCHLGSGKGLSKSEAGTRAAMQGLMNPLTAQIGAVKRDHDAKAKLERDQEAVKNSFIKTE